MKKLKLHLAIFPALVLALVSCDSKAIEGNGNIVREERAVEMYNDIEVEGSADIVYSARPDTTAYLYVEADENIAPLIEASVSNGVLSISTPGNIKVTKLVVHTNSPSLKAVSSHGTSDIRLTGAIAGDELQLELKGTGNLIAENLVYKSIDVRVKGTGDVSIAGQTDKASIRISGTGDVNAEGLQAKVLAVDIKGMGDVWASVQDDLSVNISGTGDVYYKGTPTISKQNIKGVGKLKPIE